MAGNGRSNAAAGGTAFAQGEDVDVMRQRLHLAEIRRQKEFLRHELKRAERDDGYAPNLSPSPVHRGGLAAALSATLSTSRASPGIHIPEHFTPVATVRSHGMGHSSAASRLNTSISPL
jgi:hypothetical protein